MSLFQTFRILSDMQRSQYQMEASQGGVSLYSPQGRGRQVSTQGRGDRASTQGRGDQASTQGRGDQASTQGRGDQGSEQEKDLGLCTFSGRLRTVQHWLQGPGLPASVMFRVYARWINCLPYTAS